MGLPQKPADLRQAVFVCRAPREFERVEAVLALTSLNNVGTVVVSFEVD